MDLDRGADPAMRFSELCPLPGMPERKQLEFQHQHHPLAVGNTLQIVFPQRFEPFLRVVAALHPALDVLNVLTRLVLEQGKKKIFFTVEMRIKRPARMAGVGGDVLDTGSLEAIAGKYPPGGFDQFPPGRFGSPLMLVKRRHF